MEIEQRETEKEELEGLQKGKFIYIYGIINDRNIELNSIKGLKEKEIEKINFRDISILTSDYPTLYPILKEDEAIQHSEILKEIVKETTVIPMAFGTVFKNQKILETVLSKSYQAIKETLILIDGKIELGIKVIKNKPDYIQSGNTPHISDNILNKIALEILGSLNELSVKSIRGDKFSERLLLNCSFLVERNNFSKFSDKIAQLEKKYKDLKFIYTGPWPPYSFIDIKIGGS